MKTKVHIFNSFFYRRISAATMPLSVSADSEKKKQTGFDFVRSWTRNSNLFEKDFILVPICENLHWFLAIICYPKLMLSQQSVVVDLDPVDEKAPLFSNIVVILTF